MKSKSALFWSIVAAAAALDQGTKWLVAAILERGESVPVVPYVLSLRARHNAAGAYGLGASVDPAYRELVWIALPLGLMAAVLWMFVRLEARAPRFEVALALIVGGAVGNLVDRGTQGFVLDFLRFGSARQNASYNVADLVIFAGFTGLLGLASAALAAGLRGAFAGRRPLRYRPRDEQLGS